MIQKMRLKSDMRKVFYTGEFYLKKKRDGKEFLIYPTILKTEIKNDRKTIVFTIPTGINPSDVKKKEWIFKQVFGDNIELKGNGKRYIFNIYSDHLTDSYDFNLTDWETTHRIPIVVGKDMRGQKMTYDMVKYPHLLIAGETGAGKSTQLRAILTNLIMSDRPVRLYLADLKRSEFHLFRRLEKVKKVVNNADDLYGILTKLEGELTNRGMLLEQEEVAHIDDLENPPPYIVLCIDEVAMLKKEKKVMEVVEDISAIGRALGVFLILSMQRPDRDVLDGKLKNNLTVRMAFKHSDRINSNITLGKVKEDASEISIDTPGRMYFKSNQLIKAQGPYLDLEEAKKLLEPLKTEKHIEEAVETPQEDDSIFGVLLDEQT